MTNWPLLGYKDSNRKNKVTLFPEKLDKAKCLCFFDLSNFGQVMAILSFLMLQTLYNEI